MQQCGNPVDVLDEDIGVLNGRCEMVLGDHDENNSRGNNERK
jgi:hypothetical protein